MKPRPVQLQYVDNIKTDVSNLLIAPMGLGKSFILKLIVDKYFHNKKVLVLTNRRQLTLQLSSYFKDHTFILSGKDYDENAHIHLATFQTLNRRDVDLSTYDLVCVDEIHEVFNVKLMKTIKDLNCTKVYLTGTPINSKGKFLGKFDNVMEYINIEKMIELGYLAKTRFISKANILADEADIGIQNGDYKSEGIERVIDKQAIIQWVVNDNLEYKWSTEHKAIMYVNSIATAIKVMEAINEDTVKVVHSKLSSKELESTLKWFNETNVGILINVRMLTTGTDIPTVDTIINLSPTKIISLYLQSIWRGSRVNGNKETIVYDYTGNLLKISPYYTDWYKKSKPSCRDKCKEFPENSIARHMCLETCKIPEHQFIICNGKPSYTFEQDPYKSEYIVKGIPCNQGYPFHAMEYKTTVPPNSIGKLWVWSKCPCGCITRYTLETMTQPSKTIELYSNVVDSNNIIFIYNKKERKGLVIAESIRNKNYSYKTVYSQDELYEYALKLFKGSKFTIGSNTQLPKLDNITVIPKLDEYIDLVDWTKDNPKVMRKIITHKLNNMVKEYGMKKGYVYWFKKLVKESNERYVMKQLDNVYDKYSLMALKRKLEQM